MEKIFLNLIKLICLKSLRISLIFLTIALRLLFQNSFRIESTTNSKNNISKLF